MKITSSANFVVDRLVLKNILVLTLCSAVFYVISFDVLFSVSDEHGLYAEYSMNQMATECCNSTDLSCVHDTHFNLTKTIHIMWFNMYLNYAGQILVTSLN